MGHPGEVDGLQRGVSLFNQGHYWEAHEAWEEVWTPDRHGPDRGFYKGLIQIAAGCLHYRRGNRRGALNKLRGGSQLLQAYLPAHHGIDLMNLTTHVAGMLDELEAREDWPALELPRLQSGP